ncbi:hypothetical protein HPB50_025469 [Hyalomma asiaticum]|uniref:Uncharacterized protein n=1 Tax=Hyalomma asiaticum TaxID=266040 RepID=A0ACB7SAJ0_HYAAI|nr:hypothetical protein HPB50_025469 [Hyalomma asiaticum]
MGALNTWYMTYPSRACGLTWDKYEDVSTCVCQSIDKELKKCFPRDIVRLWCQNSPQGVPAASRRVCTRAKAVTLWTLYTLHLVSQPARAAAAAAHGAQASRDPTGANNAGGSGAPPKRQSIPLRELTPFNVPFVPVPTPPPRRATNTLPHRGCLTVSHRPYSTLNRHATFAEPVAEMAGTSSSAGGSGSSGDGSGSSVQPPRTLPPTPRFKSFSSSCLHSPTTELHTYSDVSPTDLATTPTWQDRPTSRFVFSISPPRASSCLGNQSPQEYRPLCATSGDGERARGSRGPRGGGLGAATKEDEEEDVSRKARWIIITTAVSLFVMSVLLVGIMLRLAPVIDDLGEY